MHLIEPCCTQKHIARLRKALGENGTDFFHGYGDLSLTEMLPVILMRYSEADLLLVAPALPETATELLATWMRKQWMKIDGSGKVYVIGHLMLVSDLSEKRSPLASQWAKDNPFPGRLTLKNAQQNDTAILLPDIAFVGPMNLKYGGHFTAMATKNAATIKSLRDTYEKL